MAGPTRLELATSGVTGRRSNQLNYGPAWSCFRTVVRMHYRADLTWGAMVTLVGLPPNRGDTHVIPEIGPINQGVKRGLAPNSVRKGKLRSPDLGL